MQLKKTIGLSLIPLLVMSILVTFPLLASPSENIYLDDLPSSTTYVIRNSGATYWAVRYDGKVLWEGSNDDTTIQNAIDQTTTNGGIVFIQQGSYSASVTVKSNVLLLLDYGVSGVSYSLTGTGIALYYLNGYVINDAPLNMTGNQILYGLFHAGDTATRNALSPTEAQWFWDTTLHDLYVYNGTAWESWGDVSANTHDTYQDYDYLIYEDGGTCYLKNGTTEQNDASSASASTLTQWAINNLTNGGMVAYGTGSFTFTDTVTIDGSVIPSLKISGNGWGRGSGLGGTQLSHGTGTFNMFTLINIPTFTFRDFAIQMNDQNGHGIALLQDSGTYGCEHCYIDNLYIRNNVLPYYAIYLENWFYSAMGDIWIDTKGHGLGLVEKSNSTKQGNSHVDYAFIRCFTDDGIAINAWSEAPFTKNGPVLWTWDWVQVYGTTGSPASNNITGICMDSCLNWEFDYLICESMQYDIKLLGTRGLGEATKGNLFHGGYLTAMEGIYCDSNTENNLFENFHVWTNYAGSPKLIQDYGSGNMFKDLRSGSGWDYSQNVFQTSTRFEGTLGQSKWGEYGDSGEASNDDWIAHNCIVEPFFISLTVEETDANYAIQLKTKNSTHFQIYLYDLDASALETTDKTIIWYADC